VIPLAISSTEYFANSNGSVENSFSEGVDDDAGDAGEADCSGEMSTTARLCDCNEN
jgi:hypothetical protein